MTQVELAKDVDVSNISFGKIRVMNDGTRVVPLQYGNGQLAIQIPEMVCREGASVTSTRASLILNIKKNDKRNGVHKFRDVLQQIDARIEEAAREYGAEWFQKNPATYSSILRVDNAGQHSILLSVPGHGDVFGCPVHNSGKMDVNVSDLAIKGIRVTAILKCAGVWIAAGRMGLSWKTAALRCDPPLRYVFNDDDRYHEKDEDVNTDDGLADDVLVLSGDDEEDDASNVKTVIVNGK